MISRSCAVKSNPERVREYDERLRHQPDHSYLAHAGRVARGVKLQGELIRLPIPRHRALVVAGKVKRPRRKAS
jgi:hypothetical protein